MNRVAIVIVTFNSGLEIGPCLDAVTPLPGVEIVVVDNGSADATVDEVSRRGVRLIANNRNAGFAGAVNQGVRATTAPMLLLLNPDAVLQSGPAALEAEFSDPRVGAAGGMLTDDRGNPQSGFMARNLPTPTALVFEVLGVNALWPNNPSNWHYRCLGLNPLSTACVEQPAGAFLMFPRRVWESVGCFDERFWPVWFEDVDFCARIRQAGLLVRYNPQARAIHSGGHSVSTLSLEIRERYWYGSLLEYASKHFAAIAFRVVCGAVVVGAVCRAGIRFPQEGVRAVAVYRAVCRLAIGRFFGVRAT